jgi:hypothetical protein
MLGGARRQRPSSLLPQRADLAPVHVWMAPAWQEKM